MAHTIRAERVRAQVRQRLLRMHYESNVGHVGGNLSSLDILLCLFHDRLSTHDCFILSKGHAAGALYATLWSVGKLTESDLCTFHQDSTRLSGHPPPSGLPGVLFATGSLGHGPSLSAGIALARKLKCQSGRVFCLTSDGEWNEGSCWEAIIFAQHHRLDNLTLIVDLNGLQGFGSTREIANLAPLADKFRSFNLSVDEVQGHNLAELVGVLNKPATGPQVIIAHTHKGCGVSFMEDKFEWHYLPMTDAQYRQALLEVEMQM